MNEIASPKPDCVIVPAKIPSHEIGFINALLDDHEGMVVVRTVNASEGRIEFWVSPDLVDDFEAFIHFVNERLDIPLTLSTPIPESDEVADYLKRISRD